MSWEWDVLEDIPNWFFLKDNKANIILSQPEASLYVETHVSILQQ